MLRVAPAFDSRVSNAIVFGRVHVQPFSEQLLQTQLVLLGKVARSPDNDPLRQDTFAPGTVRPQIGRYVQRVGRTRQHWTGELIKIGPARMGATRFELLLTDRSTGAQKRWKHEVRRLFAGSGDHSNGSRPSRSSYF